MLNRVQRYNKYFKYTTIIATQFSIPVGTTKKRLFRVSFLVLYASVFLIRCAYFAFLIRFAKEITPAGHTKRHKWHPTHLLPTTRGLRSSPNSIAW